MNINKSLAVLGMFAAMTACTGLAEIENSEENIVEKEVVIHAVHEYDEADTKTVLKEDGSVWWKPNDAIGIFFGSRCNVFYAYNYEDSPSAYFVGNALVVEGKNENSGSVSGDYTYWGVFPPFLENEETSDSRFDYTAGNEDYFKPSCNGSSVDVYLPARQRGVAGTFDSNYFISLARSNDYRELSFYNLCGGVRFTVESEGIHTVVFKGNGDESLAGGVRVVMNEAGVPVVSRVKSGKNEVVLTTKGQGYFRPGKMYYMVMLPSMLEEGFTMTFYKDKSVGVYESTGPVEVKRSVFGTLTNPDSGLTYETYIPAEGIKIVTETDEMCIGDTLRLEAVVTPADCPSPIEWVSSDETVATVDADGLVTAVSEGSVRIYAKVDDLSTYKRINVYEEFPSSRVPSLKFRSVDLTDVKSIVTLNDYNLSGEERKFPFVIKNDESQSLMKFNISSDDSKFVEFFNEHVSFDFENVWWLTDKFLFFTGMSWTSDVYETPRNYVTALDESPKEMILRLSDGMVFVCDGIMPFVPEDNWFSQYQSGRVRLNSDGNSIFLSYDGYINNLCEIVLEDNIAKITMPFDFYASDFWPYLYYGVLLDKNDNLLTFRDYWVSDDEYVYELTVLCSDGSIVLHRLDSPYQDAQYYEYDYSWYVFKGAESGYLDIERVSVESGELVFTDVVEGEIPANSWISFTKSDGCMFAYVDDSVIVVELDGDPSISVHPVDLDALLGYDWAWGRYFYSLDGAVLSKYDIVTGTFTEIVCDRSNVPQLVPPTYVYYDYYNENCFYENGLSLSDSATVTVLTDSATGDVTVVKGKSYFEGCIYVNLKK